ncbi:MAG: helix-turn-helix domain-containing protein [Bryobacteraceae bacterium]
MSRFPAQVHLTKQEETTLREWTHKGTAEQRLVDRAKIILLSHEGLTVEKIAQQLDTRPARVSKWRQRFVKDRLSALSDAPRSGKPHKYGHETESRVLALLDQPAPEGYAQWNGALLAEALGDVSADQVWRILRRRRLWDVGGRLPLQLPAWGG